eukprot:CAMPEP_0206449056 /NCGR_PEP_ID=MMETSP0324_2-20121206/17862_1 /ASSEMBLY_ACC=CAM_ASM_000836 /TAXON_ID=2866 /ORGANISM="Crypthecodinium cohnii, Strain Seligo" /LENGTH=307 /DNA_ID=CAMNT_0053918361 /DNA_START=87 /DNA_END=1011 /DNA_ORIENTATION=-
MGLSLVVAESLALAAAAASAATSRLLGWGAGGAALAAAALFFVLASVLVVPVLAALVLVLVIISSPPVPGLAGGRSAAAAAAGASGAGGAPSSASSTPTSAGATPTVAVTPTTAAVSPATPATATTTPSSTVLRSVALHAVGVAGKVVEAARRAFPIAGSEFDLSPRGWPTAAATSASAPAAAAPAAAVGRRAVDRLKKFGADCLSTSFSGRGLLDVELDLVTTAKAAVLRFVALVGVLEVLRMQEEVGPVAAGAAHEAKLLVDVPGVDGTGFAAAATLLLLSGTASAPTVGAGHGDENMFSTRAFL